MTRTKELSDFSGADVFDIRDVIARFEELEDEREALVETRDELETGENVELLTADEAGDALEDARTALAEWDADEGEEYNTLKDFLESVKGYGGDEQWRGDWYPVTFTADSYFEDYAREFASDVYGREIDAVKWPFDCIDWSKAADELRTDYSSVDLDGNEFWYR